MVPAIFTVYLSAYREFRLHRWFIYQLTECSVFIGRFPAGNWLFPFASDDFLREICCFRLHQKISCGKFAVSICIRRFPEGNLLFPFASVSY